MIKSKEVRINGSNIFYTSIKFNTRIARRPRANANEPEVGISAHWNCACVARLFTG